MVNSEKFSERLQRILDYYDLSAAAFADSIDVGRSSISHILSGRNKPSLDFVMKIIQAYPEVEVYWLLNGKGSFPAKPQSQEETSKQALSSPSTNIPASLPEIPAAIPENKKQQNQTLEKEIQKIVIFYKDGTFDAFTH